MWEGFDEALNAGPVCSALSRQVDPISAICYRGSAVFYRCRPSPGRVAEWADSARSKAKDYWPQMPEGVEDRNADAWEATAGYRRSRRWALATDLSRRG